MDKRMHEEDAWSHVRAEIGGKCANAKTKYDRKGMIRCDLSYDPEQRLQGADAREISLRSLVFGTVLAQGISRGDNLAVHYQTE